VLSECPVWLRRLIDVRLHTCATLVVGLDGKVRIVMLRRTFTKSERDVDERLRGDRHAARDAPEFTAGSR
jgi:hypothetical protein